MSELEPPNEYPCKFCSKQAVYSPIQGQQAEALRKRLLVYFCSDCRAEYLLYRQSHNLYSTSLYTKVNDRMYRWSVMEPGFALLWLVKQPGTPGITINKGLSVVKSFDPMKGEMVPSITPENINEKVRIWLVFL